MAGIDEIVGTWTFVSSENDEAYAAAEGTPIEVLKKISQVGTTLVYEKTGEGQFKCTFTSEGTGVMVYNVENNKPVTTAGEFQGEKFELTQTVKYVGDGVWEEDQEHPGGKMIHETKVVKGDTMNVKYTCNGVSGSSVYKRA